MNTKLTEPKTSLQFTFILALIVVMLRPNLIHAQNTHTWVDPNGGNFTSPLKWSPLGFPSSLDTAVFNLNADYDVLLIDSRSVDYAKFEGAGNVTFSASGTSGTERVFSARTMALINQNSTLTLQPNSSHNLILDIEEGITNYGTVVATDGTQVSIPTTNLGGHPLAGFVVVDGASASGLPTLWEAENLYVSFGGVDVTNGGIFVADFVDLERGTIEVEDAGSRLSATESIDIGRFGQADFDIRNGGTVTSKTISIALMQIFANLRMTSSDPNNISRLINTDDMFVGGTPDYARGVGSFILNENSHAEIMGKLLIWDDGSVQLNHSNTLVADVIENEHGGEFAFSGGMLQVNQFVGDLDNDGGMLVPGGSDFGSTTILGDFSSSSDASMKVDVGGTIAGSTHDLVNVSGLAIIDGSLDISLANGFVPAPTNTFTILSSSTLFGSFDNVSNGQRIDTFDGSGTFIVNYGIGSPFDENRIVLSEFEAAFILGDVNGDGFANLLDVEPFVDVLTSSGYHAAADINGDGVVNLLDVEPFVELLAG